MPARKPPSVARLPFDPPAGQGVDMEVFSIRELRARAPPARLHAAHRIEFYQLIFVTQGRCTHEVDFVPHACEVGAWIIVRPGQVQRFDTPSAWDGWIVALRPELLLPQTHAGALPVNPVLASLDTLPNHLLLNELERQACVFSLDQMGQDARSGITGPDLQALLRLQLPALVLRLHLAQRRQTEPAQAAHGSERRFQKYRQAVEANFHRWHQVSQYAAQLACTEKSLTRATLQVAGMSAKAYLSQRIVLEARRLLVYTSAPISAIANQLGFDEASNFAKFFKREADCVPGEFRRRQVTR